MIRRFATPAHRRRRRVPDDDHPTTPEFSNGQDERRAPCGRTGPARAPERGPPTQRRTAPVTRRKRIEAVGFMRLRAPGQGYAHAGHTASQGRQPAAGLGSARPGFEVDRGRVGSRARIVVVAAVVQRLDAVAARPAPPGRARRAQTGARSARGRAGAGSPGLGDPARSPRPPEATRGDVRLRVRGRQCGRQHRRQAASMLERSRIGLRIAIPRDTLQPSPRSADLAPILTGALRASRLLRASSSPRRARVCRQARAHRSEPCRRARRRTSTLSRPAGLAGAASARSLPRAREPATWST